MNPKTSRRRLDVNLDELDRIIAAAMQAPLSEAEGKTLRTALHAMADRLMPRRSTEKTRAVLEAANGEAVQAGIAPKPLHREHSCFQRSSSHDSDQRCRFFLPVHSSFIT